MTERQLPGYLSVEEAATLLSLSIKTIPRRIADGTIANSIRSPGERRPYLARLARTCRELAARARAHDKQTPYWPLDTRDLEERLLADDKETTLVIGCWIYQGTGWTRPGDQGLALAAAARAREYHEWRAQQRRTARQVISGKEARDAGRT